MADPAPATDTMPPDRRRESLTAADASGAPRRRGIRGYSRFVTFMKVVLPVAALLLIGLIVIWPQLDLGNQRFGLRFAKLQATEADVPAMVNARFVGADRRDQPFTITADLAKNLLSGEKEVELEMPKADLTVKDGSWLVLTANEGLYNPQNKTLNLEGAVNLFHDSGYEFTTKTADVNLASGDAQGSAPVKGQGPFGNLEAEGFRLENKGATIYFMGKAKLVIYPGATGQIR